MSLGYGCPRHGHDHYRVFMTDGVSIQQSPAIAGQVLLGISESHAGAPWRD